MGTVFIPAFAFPRSGRSAHRETQSSAIVPPSQSQGPPRRGSAAQVHGDRDHQRVFALCG